MSPTPGTSRDTAVFNFHDTVSMVAAEFCVDCY